MAPDLTLALLLLWAPAVQATTLRFGISLDLTGPACTYCHDALAGLLVWQRAVNDRAFELPGGSKLRVQLDVRDDGGSLEGAKKNYLALVNVSDFLIGPGYGFWTESGFWTAPVAEIAEMNQKLLVVWALNDYGVYGMQPLANSTMEVEAMNSGSLQALSNLTGFLQDFNERRLGPTLSNCSGQSCQQHVDGNRLGLPLHGCEGGSCATRPPLDEAAAAMAWLDSAQEHPPLGLSKPQLRRWFLGQGAPSRLATRIATELSRPSPEPQPRHLQSSNLFFDTSIPKQEWADDLIERISSKTGAHKFLFVWFPVFTPDGADSCLAYRDRVLEKNGTTWAYSYSLQFFTDLALDFRVIKYLNPDVLFLCGEEISLTITIASSKGFNVDTNAIAVDRPVGTVVAKALKGVNVNYLLEPLPLPPPLMNRPCDVFGSMQGFVDAFHQSYGVMPGLAALETAGVGVSLTQALLHADSTDAESVAAWLRSGEMPAHFLGPMAFSSEGKLMHVKSSTRQFLPLPKDTFTPTQQYNHSRLAIVVQTEDKETCGDDCGLQLRDQISFPAPDWLNKMAEVYPCTLGCEWEGNRCSPCDEGEYRGEQDLQCRPCQDGDYADAPGAAFCLECPPGGRCSTKASKPVASMGHFRVEVAFDLFPHADLCDPARQKQVTEVSFEKCQPPEVCADSGCTGTNQGMLCGQCANGYTYHGPGMGNRICRECPHQVFVFVAFLAVVLLYIGLALGLSYLGEKAAYSSGYMPCTLTRAVLHHLHLLGISYEAMRADAADTVSSYLLVPIDVLHRPLELIMFDCFKGNTNSNTAVKTLCEVYPVLYPCSLGLNFGLHFVLWLLSVCRMSTAAAAAHALEEHKGQLRNGPSWDWCLEETVAQYYSSDMGLSQAVQAMGSQQSGSTNSVAADTEEWRSYTRLFGPGRRFSQLHESFRFRAYCSSFSRTSLALTMLLYPVQLRGLTRCLACEGIASEQRLRMDFDVICKSSSHRELVWFDWSFQLFFLFAVPIGLLLYLVTFAHKGFKVIEVRRSCAVLFSGFKERKVAWEVAVVLRTGFMIWASSMPTVQERFTAMVSVMVLYLVLIFFKQPFLPNFREGVNTFTIMSMLSVVVVLGMGRINAMDDGLWYDIRLIRVPVLVASYIVHILVAAFAFLLASFDFALKVDSIVQFGASISSWLTAFQNTFQVVRSLQTVEYVPEGNEHFIDVSTLSNFEKLTLARSLTRTVSACIDSGHHFRTWMVEKAIHEAFRRAMQARAAWLRQLYSEFGTTTWFMAGLFRVTLRSPDIHFAEEKAEDKSNGVTVDELEIALHDVNEDILVHHPTIFCRPRNADTGEQPQQQPQPHGGMERAYTLHSSVTDNQRATGSMDTGNFVSARPSATGTEDDDDGLDMLHQFSGETREYKLERSHAQKRELLEATLHDLELECEKLQGQLEALDLPQQPTPSTRSSPRTSSPRTFSPRTFSPKTFSPRTSSMTSAPRHGPLSGLKE